MSLCSDVEIDIPDMTYDWTHKIGKAYNKKGTNKNCKSQPLVIEQCLQVKKQNEQICKNQNWFNKEKVYSSIEF